MSDLTESKEEPAKSYDGGKPPVAWVPSVLLKGVSSVLWKNAEEGGGKYPRGNWKGGMSFSRSASSALRHMHAWIEGEDNDPESGMNHLWHAACRIMFLMWYSERPDMVEKFDDRKSL